MDEALRQILADWYLVESKDSPGDFYCPECRARTGSGAVGHYEVRHVDACNYSGISRLLGIEQTQRLREYPDGELHYTDPTKSKGKVKW